MRRGLYLEGCGASAKLRERSVHHNKDCSEEEATLRAGHMEFCDLWTLLAQSVPIGALISL